MEGIGSIDRMMLQTVKNWLRPTLGEIWGKYRTVRFRYKWCKVNKDNGTIAMSIFDMKLVHVGKCSYGELNVTTFSDKHRLMIGNYVSIAQHVSFLLDVEHRLDCISTYPFKVKVIKDENEEAFGKGDIIIDDDVWIGYGATILSGVHIHQGAVVAAGSVVSKDVPPYAIVGGAPAKVIRYRFNQSVIDFLLTLDYGNLDSDIIRSYVDVLYNPIDGMELDDIKELYSWFPKHCIPVISECRARRNV